MWHSIGLFGYSVEPNPNFGDFVELESRIAWKVFLAIWLFEPNPSLIIIIQKKMTSNIYLILLFLVMVLLL